MRDSPRFAFFVNSTLAFACAQLLGSALHEAGHGIAAQLLGFSPRIYAFFEDNPTGTPAQTLLILAAGPVTSLVLGAAFFAWYRLSKPHYTFGRLLLFWLAVLSGMTFVNYLIVTPFLAAGDTAQFADILGWPVLARYAVAAVGVLFVLALSRPAATAMLGVAPASIETDSVGARRRFILHGFYLPLLAGLVLTAVAGIGGRPINVFYGLLGTLGNIDIVVAALYARVAEPSEGARSPDAPLRIAPAGIALYLALVATYIFAFSRGVPV